MKDVNNLSKNTIKIGLGKKDTEEEVTSSKSQKPQKKPKSFPRIAKFFDKLTFYTILATIFLVPLIFSSKTFDTLELPKQVILLVLASLSLFSWVAKIIFLAEPKIKKSALNLAIIVFLVSSAISTIGSLSPLTSFLGFYSRGSSSLLMTIVLVVFFFIAANSIETKEQLKKVFGTFFISVGAVALFAFLQVFGIFVLPSAVTKSKIFNTIGGIEALSVILALALLITISILMREENKFKISSGILGILSFVLLVGLNVNHIWYGIFIGTLAIIAISLASKSTSLKGLAIPAFVLVISFFMIFSKSFGLNLPREVQLNRSTAYNITKSTLKDRLLFGSGPETFVYDYSQFRPQEINQSNIWQLRFDKANNEYLQVTATTGFLGLVSYLSLFVIMAVLTLTYVLKSKNSFGKFLGIGLFGSSLFLLINNYFHYNNTSVNFVIFLLLAITVGLRSLDLEEDSKVLSVSSMEARAFSFIIVVLALFGVGFVGYFGSNLYRADVYYRKGLEQSLSLDTINEAKDSFKKAAELNNSREIYQLSIARVELILANQEGLKGEDERNVEFIKERVQDAISAGQGSLALNEVSVASWESMAVIYRTAGLYAANALPWIEKCYQEAAVLEPTNPYLFNGLGQVYLTAQEYDRAIAMFEKAIELKDDLGDPYFNLGLAYRGKKEYSKAKDYFNKILEAQPSNEDIKKQLDEIDKLEKGIAVEAENEGFLRGQPPVEEQEVGGEGKDVTNRKNSDKDDEEETTTTDTKTKKSR